VKREEILEIINKNNGIISNKDALEYGITRVALHRLKEEGILRSVSRGVYSLNNESPDMMWIIQNRCRKGTFSHETALYFHDLTDQTPSEHVMTVPASYNTKTLKDLPVEFRYVKPEFIDLGKKKVKTNQGNDVFVYDLERTICDIIRNKESMDDHTVNYAIREYVYNKKSKISLLMIYAKKMGLEKKVRATMGVLL
jgi:predicted transcriptional regulator of viral defense system